MRSRCYPAGRCSPLSSRGLGRRPLTAETGVRIPVAVPLKALHMRGFCVSGVGWTRASGGQSASARAHEPPGRPRRAARGRPRRGCARAGTPAAGRSAEKRSWPSHGNERETVATRPLTANARSWRPGPAPEIRPVSCAGSSPCRSTSASSEAASIAADAPPPSAAPQRAHRPAEQLAVRPDGIEAGTVAARAEEARPCAPRAARMRRSRSAASTRSGSQARVSMSTAGRPAGAGPVGRAAVHPPRQVGRPARRRSWAGCRSSPPGGSRRGRCAARAP